MDYVQELKIIDVHKEIENCRRCEDKSIDVEHTLVTKRGGISKVVIVGEQPGASEINSEEAFIGPAGKKLMSWLVEAKLGGDRKEVFQNAYFTSLCKCAIKEEKKFHVAAANCFEYLSLQISIIKPTVFIPLGQRVMNILFGVESSLGELVGNSYNEQELSPTLMPLLPEKCAIIPLPHPSPRSLWLNKEKNSKLLSDALRLINEKKSH